MKITVKINCKPVLGCIVDKPPKNKKDLTVDKNTPCVYILPGPPIPLARPRHGNSRTWNPQKKLKIFAGIDLQRQHDPQPLLSGPLHLTVNFYLQIPTSLPERKRTLLADTLHHIKPDLSNLIKFVEDAANNILYKDDASISFITSKKLYSTNPRTEFTIVELENDLENQA